MWERWQWEEFGRRRVVEMWIGELCVGCEVGTVCPNECMCVVCEVCLVEVEVVV